MATDEQNIKNLVLELVPSNSQSYVPVNNTLVSVLAACSIQPSFTELVVRQSSPNAVAPTNVHINLPAQAAISTVAQTFPATNVNLQIIFKK